MQEENPARPLQTTDWEPGAGSLPPWDREALEILFPLDVKTASSDNERSELPETDGAPLASSWATRCTGHTMQTLPREDEINFQRPKCLKH